MTQQILPQKVKLAARWPILFGLALYILSAVVVATWSTSKLESTIFHFIFGLPDALYPVLDAIVPVMMIALLGLVLFRSWMERTPVRTLIAVGSIAASFAMAFASKSWFDLRGRPEDLLDVVARGIADSSPIGFPSSHMAIAVALTVAAIHAVPIAFRAWLWAIPLAVALARVHSGEHMPLDLIGGFGLGLLAGGIGVALNDLRQVRGTV